MRYPPYGPQAAVEIRTAVDKVRVATIALALDTIDDELIEGSMAELGVYRGEYSDAKSFVWSNRYCTSKRGRTFAGSSYRFARIM